jgi:hypothetical protein
MKKNINKKKGLKKKKESLIKRIKTKIIEIINNCKISFIKSDKITKGITIFCLILALVFLILGFLYKNKITIKKEKILFNFNDPTLQSFSNMKKKSIVENKNIDKNGNFINNYNKKKGIFIQEDTNIKLQMRTNNNYNDDYFNKYKTTGPQTGYSNLLYIFDKMNQNRYIMNPKTKDIYLNLAIK